MRPIQFLLAACILISRLPTCCLALDVDDFASSALAGVSLLLSQHDWRVIRILGTRNETQMLARALSQMEGLKSSIIFLEMGEEVEEVPFEGSLPVATIFVNIATPFIEAFLSEAWAAGRPIVDSFVIFQPDEEEAFSEVLTERFPNFAVFQLGRTKEEGRILNQVLKYDGESKRRFAPANIWRRGKGFSNEELFKRITHMDFAGHKFRVVPMVNGSHPMQINYSPLANGTYVGTDAIKWGIMGKHMNFGIRIVHSVDGKVYGILNRKTGQWRGLVGMLQREEADWSLPKISLNPERHKVIDWVQLPYIHQWSAITFWSLPPSRIKPWFTIVYPFQLWVWVGFAASFLVMGPILMIIYNRGFVINRKELSRVYNWMASVATGRGMKLRMHPGVASSLLALMSWAIMASFVEMAYTSILASSLMVPVMSKPIDTWDDILNSGYDIKYPTTGHIVNSFLKSATEGSGMNKIYKKSLMQPEGKTEIPFKVLMIHQNFKETPNSIYVSIEHFPLPSAYMFNASGFQVLKTGKSQNFAYGTSIPFRKHFPYLQLFGKYNFRFWCMGLTMKFETKMLQTQDVRFLSDQDRARQGDFSKLRMGHILGPLVMTAAGLGVCSVLFAYELAVALWASNVNNLAKE